jgi:hypothetical protein
MQAEKSLFDMATEERHPVLAEYDFIPTDSLPILSEDCPPPPDFRENARFAFNST